MQDYWFTPSDWQWAPTALLHMLFVELRAVWATYASFYFICHFLAELLQLSDPSLSNSMKNDAVYVVLAVQGLPTILLVLYHIFEFIAAGAPTSCGSGAYLMMTWRMETTFTYRLLVGLMFVTPSTILIIVSTDFALVVLQRATLESQGYGSTSQKEMLLGVVVPTVTTFISLLSLAFPVMPRNGWNEAVVKKIVFKRSVQEANRVNDVFGLRLIDAFWKAKHGKIDALLSFVEHPEDVEIVLASCCETKEV